MLVSTVEQIRQMEIRGAGRIARAAAGALADHATVVQSTELNDFVGEMEQAANLLVATRPTAVSLPNAVHLVMAGVQTARTLEEARSGIIASASQFITSSEQAVQRIASIGARHIRDGDVVMTHCNSEAALACILEAHRQGKEIEVYATEVRPRNQGLVTIRTLNDAGIRTSYIVDSAVRSFINEVDLVLVGADAISVNGAVVNKIGTAQMALAAHEARVNLVVAAETYKFAPLTILGNLIEIEERPAEEVLTASIASTLPHVRVRNPAFDVTPADYVDLIITEEGAIPPEMAYIIIRDHLGWSIEQFDRPAHGADQKE
ncbi:ribose 1,5-bisphosphate isomerase [Methanosphaerula palustris]|uniref:Ribose 1,5-bisphosphate isomerase n=1 Tax=Methanosphaerula palustris (strain ATCC BAA-1556 / DSM 19958 / E1-9c) TaxID=521011 RepID=B8GJ68_METPE|nr:ribose 1,5-bisphosphate isomerase [Methanosphaerula palustris]ACL15641.1 translation initiation factor, aIF-2BII family [Methanosphaerula palustris E1-9c]